MKYSGKLEADISPVFSVHDLYPGPGYGEVRGSLEAGQGRVGGEAILVIRALEAGDGDKQPGPDQRGKITSSVPWPPDSNIREIVIISASVLLIVLSKTTGIKLEFC